MNGLKDEFIRGWLDVLMDGWMDTKIDGRLNDGWTKWWMAELLAENINEWTRCLADELTD